VNRILNFHAFIITNAIATIRSYRPSACSDLKVSIIIIRQQQENTTKSLFTVNLHRINMVSFSIICYLTYHITHFLDGLMSFASCFISQAHKAHKAYSKKILSIVIIVIPEQVKPVMFTDHVALVVQSTAIVRLPLYCR
jgi:hypothetical protein